MKTPKRLASWGCVVGVFFVVAIFPQSPTSSGIHIANLMSASEFSASGLNKLSPTELASLDRWLNRFLIRMLARNNGTGTTGSTPSVIESEIDGEFHGWDGETIFKLTNGQIWQQAEYDYEYDYRPKVTIYKSGTGYKMKVEGVEDTIAVKRIK